MVSHGGGMGVIQYPIMPKGREWENKETKAHAGKYLQLNLFYFFCIIFVDNVHMKSNHLVTVPVHCLSTSTLKKRIKVHSIVQSSNMARVFLIRLIFHVPWHYNGHISQLVALKVSSFISALALKHRDQFSRCDTVTSHNGRWAIDASWWRGEQSSRGCNSARDAQIHSF